MSEKPHKKHEEEEGGGEVGLWYVSFADMITLLLSFFVMLTSFSSYDKQSIKKINSISRQVKGNMFAIFNPRGRNYQIDAPVFPNQCGSQGSEKAFDSNDAHGSLTPDWVPQTVAYRDRKVLRLPASKLFHVRGSGMTEEGMHCMELIGGFLTRSPSRVMVSVSNPDSADSPGGGQGIWLDRQWAVARELARRSGTSVDEIGISAGPAMAPSSSGEPQIVILLLSGGEFR
jgi:hypothetical protein